MRALLITLLILCFLGQGVAKATSTQAPPTTSQRHGSRPNQARAPGLSIDPYIRPDMDQRMDRLRPIILAASHRHNRPTLSGMSDQAFAAVIATILYNENFGWLEDDIAPLRIATPLYQDLQRLANESRLGSNFSVWPANLRPSVALEILRQELPISSTQIISVPVKIVGSQIDPSRYNSQEDLYAALTAEISQDNMAVEYLAANLERGLYRATEEGTPVSWRTLAAWHNQGIVSPQAIQNNPTANDYVRRASAYLPAARELVRPRSHARMGMGQI
ncbi:MAG: hypothetical protein HGA19_03505 [Oscillochloris sp.]|nr:hypothetical protein [Oscillochloris sp.]